MSTAGGGGWAHAPRWSGEGGAAFSRRRWSSCAQHRSPHLRLLRRCGTECSTPRQPTHGTNSLERAPKRQSLPKSCVNPSGRTCRRCGRQASEIWSNAQAHWPTHNLVTTGTPQIANRRLQQWQIEDRRCKRGQLASWRPPSGHPLPVAPLQKSAKSEPRPEKIHKRSRQCCPHRSSATRVASCKPVQC